MTEPTPWLSLSSEASSIYSSGFHTFSLGFFPLLGLPSAVRSCLPRIIRVQGSQARPLIQNRPKALTRATHTEGVYSHTGFRFPVHHRHPNSSCCSTYQVSISRTGTARMHICGDHLC